MRLSRKLEEAVHVLSDDELLSFLSEDVIHDMRVGDFSPERAEEALVGILAPYGLTEEDIDLVYEAIDEFGESMGLEEGMMSWLKGATKKALKDISAAAMNAAKDGGKEEPKEKPKKKPETKAKPEKDEGDEEAKALTKHGVKKGMKMVFGRLVKDKGGSSKKEWTTVGSLAGSREIDEAVRWLMAESDVTTLADGTLVYDFEGTPPEWVSEAFKFGGVAPLFEWSDETRRLSFDPPDDDEEAKFMMMEVLRKPKVRWNKEVVGTTGGGVRKKKNLYAWSTTFQGYSIRVRGRASVTDYVENMPPGYGFDIEKGGRKIASFDETHEKQSSEAAKEAAIRWVYTHMLSEAGSLEKFLKRGTLTSLIDHDMREIEIAYRKDGTGIVRVVGRGEIPFNNLKDVQIDRLSKPIKIINVEKRVE